VAGGQFLQWRFLRRGLWWQAHPYSLSAAPSGDELRITVKGVGDHSAGLAWVKPGTRVAIEGPYGVFTPDAAEHDRMLLIGAGVGTAPVLALLQELPARADVTVLLRASTTADLVLRDEVAEAVRARGGRLVEVVGSREQVRLDAALRRAVPDLRRREIYLCGPDGLARKLMAELAAAGVPERRIHSESFTF
jgi:ferredoxin-NADP reductase